MSSLTTMPSRTQLRITLTLVAVALLTSKLLAETPKLYIKTKHGDPQEEQRKQQMERLASQYDLKKYTITRNIVIERGAINHSSPVLTLNLRFLDNDDRSLSAYVHEQGHWLLMEHRFDNSRLFDELTQRFPNLDYRVPYGDGAFRSSYFHIVVCMLEWQALEELVGPERAREVIDWKQTDHYTGVYALILNNRLLVENIMNRHAVKW
jgi:hypothetical protein